MTARVEPGVVEGITSHPEIMGGAWCIEGTRIPSQTIWAYWIAGHVPTEIMRDYPRLDLKQIEAAIKFERVRHMKAWRNGTYEP